MDQSLGGRGNLRLRIRQECFGWWDWLHRLLILGWGLWGLRGGSSGRREGGGGGLGGGGGGR